MAWLGNQASTRFRRDLIIQPDAQPERVSVLNMYLEPAKGEVAIEEFERFAIDRLRGKHVSC